MYLYLHAYVHYITISCKYAACIYMLEKKMALQSSRLRICGQRNLAVYSP